MSRRVWKTVKTKAEKTGVAKTKERKEETRRDKIEKRRKEEEKQNKNRTIEVNKMAKEQEIQDEKEVAKKFVPRRFYKQIYIFGKKVSKRIPTKKLWDHMIETKEGFVPRKGKVYLLSREERGEVCKFIQEQLRKRYIRLLKSPQIALVFLQGRKMVRREWFRTIGI